MKNNVFEGSEAHGKAQAGPKKPQIRLNVAEDPANIGQDGRRPTKRERKMAEDTEDELEDAAQDRQAAI